jgi:hypothetical protein
MKKHEDRFTLNVHVMGNLRLTGWHWSSSQEDAPEAAGEGGENFQFRR